MRQPTPPVAGRGFSEQQPQGQSISAPVILLAEVAAALSRGTGDSALAHRAVSQLTQSNSIELIPVTPSLGEHAAKIAADHRIRGCDSVYVALAAHLNDHLITLDRQQLERSATIIPVDSPNTLT